jgi:hypothetical protein
MASASARSSDDTVRIAIHEQLSALYDDVSVDPTCQVEGTIYAQYKSDLKGIPFCLTLRDLLGQLDRVDPNPEVCQNVSDKVTRQGLHRLDKVLRVRMPGDSEQDQIRIASYLCGIRPVPLVRERGFGMQRKRNLIIDNLTRFHFNL